MRDETVGSGPAQAARPADLLDLRLAGQLALCPNDDSVVAVVQSIDGSGLGYDHRLWKFGPEGAAGELLPPGHAVSATACPRFAPDGSWVSYVSGVSGRMQGWRCSTNGEDLAALPAVDGDVRLLEWTGNAALVAVVDSPADTDLEQSVRISWLRYKSDGRAGYSASSSALWLLGLGGEIRLLGQAGGTITHVAAGESYVAYSVEPRHADSVDQRSEVRVVDLRTGADHLWWSCPAPVEGLSLAEAAFCLLVVTAGSGGSGPMAPVVWALEEQGAPTVAFPRLDVGAEYSVHGDTRPRAAPLRISTADRSQIAFAGTADGEVGLWAGVRGEPAAARMTPLGWSMTDMSTVQGTRVALCLERPSEPAEIYVGDLAGQGRPWHRISELNAGWAGPRRLREPTLLSSTSPDGTGIAGLLYQPGGTGPDTSTPLIVRIHGGPHLCYGSAFDLEVQVDVAAGYSVLLPNLRGSSGQGQAFRAASVDEWGRGDYEDLMALVQAACLRSDVDPARVYLTGGSYGGYLTNWAITRTSMFRAAVAERSISNLVSKYGTSDNGFSTNRAEMRGADLFDDGVLTLLERSPLTHAPDVTTPLLLIHGEQDKRCPIEQAEQFFVALRRLGKEVELVRFPNESHNLPYSGRPDRRVKRLEMILSWFADHP